MHLENRFEEFILSLWHSEKIDDLPNVTFPKNKADFLLYERGVILEVKYFESDRTKYLNDRINNLADTEPDFPQFYGTVHIEEIIKSHKESEKFRREICNYLARTLEDIIKKADNQIQDTKIALAKESSTGVLILLNEKFQPYDNDFIYQEVSRLLHQKNENGFKRKNIEAVWFINEHLKDEKKFMSSSAFIGPSAKNSSIKSMLNMLHFSWGTKNGYLFESLPD